MKRIAPFLTLALLAAACSDSALPTKPSPTQPNGAPAAAPAASTALAVPNPCTACAFGPKTYIVAVKEYLERFSGDPAADYLLVVQGDGDVITRARVTINGRPYFLASPERSGLPAPPLQVSVPLKASNEMRVLVTGKPGAQVTVWVLGGAAQISAAGGTVTAPGSHARVRVNQGVVNGQLRVEIADVAGPAPTYIPLTSVSQKLTLTVGSPGTTFQGGGGLQLSVPIPAGLLAGAPIFFRTFLGAIPEPFWAPASLIANAATLSLPAAHLSDLNTVFGGSVQATFTLEMLTPSTALATAAIGPRSAAPTSAGSAFGTTPYCESVPVNIAPTPPAGSGFVDCSRFPALDPYLPPSGTLPATPQVGGVGVVFVHGWNARVAAPIDLVKEQGYDCQTNGTLFYTAWNCQPNPSKASLPGSTYFRPLDSLVATVSPNPIYTFTYASYDTFTVVGQQLAAKLAAEAQTTGLSGFVLIAHSMGGLVAREAAFRLNGGQGSAGLVKGIVALGTMHTGTAGANSFTQFFATAGCLFGV